MKRSAKRASSAEAATLAEVLAVDALALFEHAFPEIRLTEPERGALRDESITRRMSAAARALHARHGLGCIERLRGHASDTVRGWAPYLVGEAPSLRLRERLELVRASADDSHFGVREWAWLGIRRHVASNVRDAVRLLTPWTHEASPRLRRFATEATRPRGVWAAKIDELSSQPSLGLPLLLPLRDDPEKYVQDSVANWLNDVAKSQPAWVKALCATWRSEGPSPRTERICTRALRSVRTEKGAR